MNAPKLFTLLFCCFISINIFAQSPKAIEADLGKSFKKIAYWEQHKNDNDVTGDDSLRKANDRFQQKLKRYTVKYPFTLNQSFSSISHLAVRTSIDKKVRCYSWDDGTGGTLRYYKNTIQYKYGGHLYSVNGQDIGLITAVYMVEVNNQTYYLITSFGQAMSIYFGEGVQVWSIQNGRLNKNSKLFKTSSGFKNAINYFYYWDEDPLAGHLRYDKKSRIFSIPITTKEEKLTGRYMRYKFTGKYFELVKN